MKFDLYLIARIDTISIYRFLEYCETSNSINKNADKTHLLLHYKICKLFGREDLALAINFIGELNQPLPALHQQELRKLYEIFLVIRSLFSDISALTIFDARNKIASLPQFSDLSAIGRVAFLSHLQKRSSATASSIAFRKTYSTALQINSLIETCYNEDFINLMARLTLRQDQKTALALNLFFQATHTKQLPYVVFRGRRELVQFYFYYETLAYFLDVLENKYCHSSLQRVGAVFKTHLKRGDFDLAEEVRLSQDRFTRDLLAQYQQLAFPEFKLTLRSSINPLQNTFAKQVLASHQQLLLPENHYQIQFSRAADVFKMSIFQAYLPLKTRATLRCISKQYRDTIPVYPWQAKMMQMFLALGKAYQEQLVKFREVKTEAEWTLVDDLAYWVFFMVLGMAVSYPLFAEYKLACLCISLLFIIAGFSLPSVLPFAANPNHFKTLRFEAETLEELTLLMIKACDALRWEVRGTVQAIELAFFKQELELTLEDVKKHLSVYPINESTLRRIVCDHPNSHLYVCTSTTSSFFKNELIQPYKNTLNYCAKIESKDLKTPPEELRESLAFIFG